MTRTDGVRVPVAAVIVLVVAAGSVLWVGRVGGDDEPTGPHRQTTVGSRSVNPAPEVGTVVRVRVLARGELLVRHRIRTDEPMTSLALTTPIDPNLSAATVSARGIELMAGSAAVHGVSRLRNGTAVFTFARTTHVRLRYVLSGALERASPSAARALARVTSLDLMPDAEQGRVKYVFEGARILNLACTRRGEIEPVPCGMRRGDDWVAELPHGGADDYRVMAQLDLLR